MNYDTFVPNLFSTKIYDEDDECYVPLFDKFTHGDSLMRKTVSYINHMIELNYIKYDPSELNFTNAGLEYMFRQHRDFIDNVMDKMDFRSFPLAYNLVNQLHKAASDIETLEEFPSNKNNIDKSAPIKIKQTMLYKDCLDDPDYNNIEFKGKSEDCDDPQGAI